MPSFFDEPKASGKQNNSYTDYIKLDYDSPIKIQFVMKEGEKAKETYKHWFQQGPKKLPIHCLLDNCPVCDRNAKLNYDKEDKDFISRDRTYAINVVDLTSVKICPKCEEVNGKNAMKCTKEDCGQMLVDVDPQPLNAIRYVEFTYTIISRVEETLAQTLDNFGIEPTEENLNKYRSKVPVTINKFKTSNGKTDYTAIFMMNDPKAIDPEEYMDKRFDLDKVGIRVNYDEMQILMNGGSFKEITEARKNSSNDKKSELESFFGEKSG